MAEVTGDRLESWKEIAAYLSRGVRTVRRWEREEGLPVHRHLHRVLGSVYAFRSEIDAWRRTGARRPAPRSAGGPGAPPAPGDLKSIAVLPFTNLSKMGASWTPSCPNLEAAATPSDVFSRMLAQGYARSGRPERAMHWLRNAADRGFINYPFLSRYDPFFERYRNDGEFLRLMETVRDRWERFEA